MIPVLERMNLKVIGEHPYKSKTTDNTIWLHDFLLHTNLSNDTDISEIRQEFEAAFNHLHIFVDPTPKMSSNYEERKRLFTTPGSNWADYNQKLLFRGGGVFSRDAKSITLTPEMKQCFDITANGLTPTELIHYLLQAPVDLIWNGEIGSYVKSAEESHSA